MRLKSTPDTCNLSACCEISVGQPADALELEDVETFVYMRPFYFHVCTDTHTDIKARNIAISERNWVFLKRRTESRGVILNIKAGRQISYCGKGVHVFVFFLCLFSRSKAK